MALRTVLCVWLVLAGTGGIRPWDTALFAQSGPSQEFRPRRLLPPKRPITDPPLLSAQEIGGQEVGPQLADNELVLGVAVNGKARAYPINMLNGPSREIINDVLGGVPIAATWCHLCHNTVVYDRRADEYRAGERRDDDRRANRQTLTFAVSGMLWNRNLVMVDSETGSLWSHFLGRAMSGPLKGTRLQAIPSELTTWGEWRREHPETTVLNLPRSSRRFVREFYQRPEDFVFGVVIDGRASHVAYPVLLKNPVLNIQRPGGDLLVTFDSRSTAAQLFERTLDGRTLTFSAVADVATPGVATTDSAQESGRMTDEQTGTVWDRASGVAIAGPLTGRNLKQRVGMPAYAAAWKVFHPDSHEVQPREAISNP